MKLLEDRILKEGKAIGADIVKVDNFLNHQLDAEFLDELAQEFTRRFAGEGINKIVTIEASGIAVAVLTGLHMNVPVVFAKKAKTSNISSDVFSAKVHSFTHNTDNSVMISRQYLSEGDRVLLIDDFLAEGAALHGLIELCRQAGATVCGIGICIEKGFQPGGITLRQEGYRVESLAIIDSIKDGIITFAEEGNR